MKLDQLRSNDALLAEVGSRLAGWRLVRNLTQVELAQRAAISRASLQRLEAGRPVDLVTFLAAVRALGFLGRMDQLLPETASSPVDASLRRERRRRRASGRRAGSRRDQPKGPWRWGDESGDRE
ncbi:MAG: helix-turn-helix domain-containing protein [Candidatus Dormibacteria bacterium]